MEREYSGYFITLEGGDGSGKTSLLPQIAQHLKDKGLNVITLHEPGGTFIGEQIRDVLHKKENAGMHPRAETLLFQASRAQIVEEVIIPRLKEGDIVLSDRFFDSTLAYQGYGHQQDLDKLKPLIEYATGGLKPDLTIFLDLDPEIGLRRKERNNCEINRMDLLPPDFYERVRDGFWEMAINEPDRWRIVDASETTQEVLEGVLTLVDSSLFEHGFIEAERRSIER
jgi:dTMP kinase